jgi:hypothetical protein
VLLIASRPHLALSSSLVVWLLVGCGIVAIASGLCGCWQGHRYPRVHCEIRLSVPFSVLQAGTFSTMIYFLPIYSQAVQDSRHVNPRGSGSTLHLFAMAGALGAGMLHLQYRHVDRGHGWRRGSGICRLRRVLHLRPGYNDWGAHRL